MLLSLEFEIRIVVIRLFVEAIQCRTAFRRYLVDLVSLLDEVDCLDLLSEVALVDFLAEDSLVNVLQLRQREEFWEQVEAQRLCGNAAAEQVDGFSHHFVVVGIESWHLLHIDPLQLVLLA